MPSSSGCFLKAPPGVPASVRGRFPCILRSTADMAPAVERRKSSSWPWPHERRTGCTVRLARTGGSGRAPARWGLARHSRRSGVGSPDLTSPPVRRESASCSGTLNGCHRFRDAPPQVTGLRITQPPVATAPRTVLDQRPEDRSDAGQRHVTPPQSARSPQRAGRAPRRPCGLTPDGSGPQPWARGASTCSG